MIPQNTTFFSKPTVNSHDVLCNHQFFLLLWQNVADSKFVVIEYGSNP
jgi:hypothetical protein